MRINRRPRCPFATFRIVFFIIMAAILDASASAAIEAVETFKATTVGMTPAGLELKIDVFRWSSEADRDAAVTALAAETPEAPPLLDLPTLGYVWPSGSGLGHLLKYAHRVAEPDGGEHITLVTGRPLGAFDRERWAATDVPDPAARGFTVIELRLDSNGQGMGTMSLAAGVAVNQEAQTVSLEDYDAAPMLLEAVARQPKPYGADGP